MAADARGPVRIELVSCQRCRTASESLPSSVPTTCNSETDRGRSLASSTRAPASTTEASRRAKSSASASLRGQQATGCTPSPVRTNPVRAPSVPAFTSTKVRHAAGMRATSSATQSRCTPTAGPRSAMPTRRARSTGASSSTTTRTMGSARASVFVSASRRASIRPSKSERRDTEGAPPVTSGGELSGLYVEPVCGSHFSQFQLLALSEEQREVSTSSAGECEPTR